MDNPIQRGPQLAATHTSGSRACSPAACCHMKNPTIADTATAAAGTTVPHGRAVGSLFAFFFLLLMAFGFFTYGMVPLYLGSGYRVIGVWQQESSQRPR